MAAAVSIESAPPAPATARAKPAAAATPFGEVLMAAAMPAEASAAPATPAAALPAEPVAALPTPAAQPTAPPSLPNTPLPVAAKPPAKPAVQPSPLLGVDAAAVAPLPTDTLAVAATPLAKAAEQPALPDPVSDPVATASPEAFLNWLEAIKALTPVAPTTPTLVPTATADAATTTVITTAAAPATDTAATLLAAAGVEARSDATPVPAPPPPPVPFTLPPPATLAAAPPVTPLPTSPVPLTMDQPEWPQRLGEQIQWHLGAGIQEARIEISPRDLGVVDVRLSVDDSGLRVHLSAAHAQTRELLQNELPRLRDALQQGGVPLADAQVGREAPRREPPQTAQSRTAPQAGGDTAPAEAVVFRRRGLLDDYA